ncbi:MAG: 3-deoxy-manno-octulosonate cytidylyltransferase [Pseudomonadota bacterium]
MDTVIVIPARYASQRFPGKPLAPLKGATGVSKTLIERTFEAATAAAEAVGGVDAVVVATDDTRIADAAKAFGAIVAMTPENCRNGSERCWAAVQALPERPNIIVNLQGDSPLTPPDFVEACVSALRHDPSLGVATPALRCTGRMLKTLRDDRRAGLVGGTTAVTAASGDALYFSKEVVPFTDADYADEAATPVRLHVGLYAYRAAALEAYAAWPPDPLETHEGLEQLRFLANGAPVRVVEVAPPGREFCELNNPVDTERVEAALRELGQA